MRHFLACCSQDARGHETTVRIDINGEQFSASGLMVVAKNYLDVYIYESWSDKVRTEMPLLQQQASLNSGASLAS